MSNKIYCISFQHKPTPGVVDYPRLYVKNGSEATSNPKEARVFASPEEAGEFLRATNWGNSLRLMIEGNMLVEPWGIMALGERALDRVAAETDILNRLNAAVPPCRWWVRRSRRCYETDPLAVMRFEERSSLSGGPTGRLLLLDLDTGAVEVVIRAPDLDTMLEKFLEPLTPGKQERP